jgi:endoglycosylceramidase
VLNEPRVMDNAEAQRAAMGGGALLTEFGSHDDITDLARMTDLADQRLSGWMYWAYKAWADPTGNPAAEGMFAKDGDLSTLKAPKADVLIRPYPQAVAGVPLSLSWQAGTRTMDLRFQPKAGVGPTDVFVPARHYKGGYDAVVTGGHVTSPAQARHLLVVADGVGQVRVVVRPHAARRAPTTTGPPTTAPAGPATPAGQGLATTGADPLVAVVGALLVVAATGRRVIRKSVPDLS